MSFSFRNWFLILFFFILYLLPIDSDGSVENCSARGVSWDGQVQARAGRPQWFSLHELNRTLQGSGKPKHKITTFASFTPPAGPRRCRTAARCMQRKMHVHRLARDIDWKVASSQCAVIKSSWCRACTVPTVIIQKCSELFRTLSKPLAR
jgi:hypothetical protein